MPCRSEGLRSFAAHRPEGPDVVAVVVVVRRAESEVRGEATRREHLPVVA